MELLLAGLHDGTLPIAAVAAHGLGMFDRLDGEMGVDGILTNQPAVLKRVLSDE